MAHERGCISTCSRTSLPGVWRRDYYVPCDPAPWPRRAPDCCFRALPRAGAGDLRDAGLCQARSARWSRKGAATGFPSVSARPRPKRQRWRYAPGDCLRRGAICRLMFGGWGRGQDAARALRCSADASLSCGRLTKSEAWPRSSVISTSARWSSASTTVPVVPAGQRPDVVRNSTTSRTACRGSVMA